MVLLFLKATDVGAPQWGPSGVTAVWCEAGFAQILSVVSIDCQTCHLINSPAPTPTDNFVEKTAYNSKYLTEETRLF